MRFNDKVSVEVHGVRYSVPSNVANYLKTLESRSLSVQAEQVKREGEALGNFRSAIQTALRIGKMTEVMPTLCRLGVVTEERHEWVTEFGEAKNKSVYFASPHWDAYLFNTKNINLTTKEASAKYNTIRIRPDMQDAFLTALKDHARFHDYQWEEN